jgi:uncharacterized protein (DUF2235 family)
MRTYTYLSMGAALALLVGCSHPAAQPPVTSIAAKNAPSWIDNPAIPDGLGAVGIAQPNSLGDIDEMRTEAEANARTRLAAMMNIRVQSMFSNLFQQVRSGSTETGKAPVSTEVANKVTEDVKRQILNENLRGATVQESYTSPTGNYYVHMVMTKETMEKAMRGAAKAQINKEIAQGEKSLEHALDKLDSAIAASETQPTN